MISAGKWIDLESIKTGHPHPERQILHVLSGIQILAIPIDRRWNVGACHETRKGAMRKKDRLGKPWKVGEVSGRRNTGGGRV